MNKICNKVKIISNFNKYLFGIFKNKIYLCIRNKEEKF